jgi:hypothetical protein
MRKLLRPAFAAFALALAACGGNGLGGGTTIPAGGPCTFSGLTQLIYPIPGATNVPDAPQQIVFAVSQLFPSSFDVLINNDPNPSNAGNGVGAFFQQIQQAQIPQPSATVTITNPLYESAAIGVSFPHATYYVFLNDSATNCTPTSAGSFTTV